MEAAKTHGFFSLIVISTPSNIKGRTSATSVKWLNHRYQVIQPEKAYANPVILLVVFDAPK